MKQNILIFCTAFMALILSGCHTNTFDNAYTGNTSQQASFPVPDPDDAVDLGLSVKWAPYNIGASKASERGNYYSFGETSTKNDYSESSWRPVSDEDDIICTVADAAATQWNENWRLPSSDDIQELVSRCSWEETAVDGIRGMKITGPNGNTIFLPAAGIFTGQKLYEVEEQGFYRCGNAALANATYFKLPNNKYYGCSIRPVLSLLGAQKESFPAPDADEAVDLGLSVKWAPYNVGASDMTGYGNYYGWGEFSVKHVYTESNYSAPQSFNCEGEIYASESDVAYSQWGNSWRMPTPDEISELYELCSVKKVNINGVLGEKFTSPNGNSIFLPAAGYAENYSIKDVNASVMYRHSGEDETSALGLPVRPVLVASIPQNPTFPVPSKTEAVDLGLSVNWAPYNVGASASTERGNYYAYGETEFKNIYCTHNYTKPESFNSQGNISGTNYDAANVKWGNGWRMPTAEEIAELWSKCIWEEAEIDGIKGIKITSLNGNSIFLPAGGIIDNISLREYNMSGYYRTADSEGYPVKYFNVSDNPYMGALIRPVIDNENYGSSDDQNLNPVAVNIVNLSDGDYRRCWWNDEFLNDIKVGGNLEISLIPEAENSGISDYGVMIYDGEQLVATISYKDNIDINYPYESSASNSPLNGFTYVNTPGFRMDISHVNSLQTNSYIESNTSSAIRLTITATDKDFAMMYNDSGYYATLGKRFKYKTYFEKINDAGLATRTVVDIIYPLDYVYTKQPKIRFENFEVAESELSGDWLRYTYKFDLKTSGALFVDTLYSVEMYCDLTDINDVSTYKVKSKRNMQGELLHDGHIGFWVSSSIDVTQHTNVRFTWWEGLLIKGNSVDTLRSNPLVFDYTGSSCEITAPEIPGWPDSVVFGVHD